MHFILVKVNSLTILLSQSSVLNRFSSSEEVCKYVAPDYTRVRRHSGAITASFWRRLIQWTAFQAVFRASGGMETPLRQTLSSFKRGASMAMEKGSTNSASYQMEDKDPLPH